jgi:hypothetical protein
MTATVIATDTTIEGLRAVLGAVPGDRLRADYASLLDQVAACKGGPAGVGPPDPAPDGPIGSSLSRVTLSA